MMKRIKFVFCYFIYNILAKYLPKSNARVSFGALYLRRFCAKGMCKVVGKNVNIERMAIFGKNVEIGDNSGIGINCVLQGRVLIGANVMMGPEVWIYTRNHKHDRVDIPMIEQGFEDEKCVVINDDVWIGSRVTILPGVVIGKGAIIGTGSVVTKSVPEYSIVAGNPAIIVKHRNET